jgi:REP element-mobilizing transposase RayT
VFETVYGHVTTRGQDRRTIFVDDGDFRRFLGHLETAVVRYELRCHSYCLMPNHFHLLFEAPPAAFGHAMKMLNGAYARYFNWRHSRSGHVFERAYHLEPVQRDVHLLECFRYIVNNPVRAGLTQTAGAWPWSSYQASVGRAPAPAWLTLDAVVELFAPYGGFADFCKPFAAPPQTDC